MGSNDAAEMLEVAKEECIRLERALEREKHATEVNTREIRLWMDRAVDAYTTIRQAKELLTDTSETDEMRNRNAYGALEQTPVTALEALKAEEWDAGYRQALLDDGYTIETSSYHLRNNPHRPETDTGFGMQQGPDGEE